MAINEKDKKKKPRRVEVRRYDGISDAVIDTILLHLTQECPSSNLRIIKRTLVHSRNVSLRDSVQTMLLGVAVAAVFVVVNVQVLFNKMTQNTKCDIKDANRICAGHGGHTRACFSVSYD